MTLTYAVDRGYRSTIVIWDGSLERRLRRQWGQRWSWIRPQWEIRRCTFQLSHGGEVEVSLARCDVERCEAWSGKLDGSMGVLFR